jgi:hypothetical protein
VQLLAWVASWHLQSMGTQAAAVQQLGEGCLRFLLCVRVWMCISVCFAF